jgi:hypothetical protein
MIVEHSFAWLEECRRLWKNCDIQVQRREALAAFEGSPWMPNIRPTPRHLGLLHGISLSQPNRLHDTVKELRAIPSARTRVSL